MNAWPAKRLRYVADLNPAVRPDLIAAPDTELSFLPMESIGEDGSLCLDRTRPVSEVRNGYSFFENGDVTFAKVTPCFENGKGALMKNLQGGAGFGTTELTVLRPKAGTCPRFLGYVLQSELFRQLGVGAMTGAGGLKRVPDEFTRDFSTPWPDADIQESISNFLDDKTARIDALIAEKERLIERLAELRQSEFSRALTSGLRQKAKVYATGHPALPELPLGWKLSRLKWVCSLLRDGTHTPPPRVDAGVPLLSVRNVQNDEFTFLSDDSLISEADYQELNRSFDVRKGDVLLAVVGATMGKVAEVRDMGRPFQIQRSLAVIRPKVSEIGSTLLAASMRAEYFQNLLWQNTGFSAQPGTYLGALADFPVPIPPPEEQTEILAHLSRKSRDFENLSQHTLDHIIRLREYRSSLISAAVTGQLQVGAALKEAA